MEASVQLHARNARSEQLSSVTANLFSLWCLHTQTSLTEKVEKTGKGEKASVLGVGSESYTFAAMWTRLSDCTIWHLKRKW